jgi:formate-dependent nitrite reductase membrane component NrfD
MAGYTAVLIADTAIPLWAAARTTLPVVFVASAASSAASLLDLTELDEREDRVVRTFGIGARAAELLAVAALERDAERVERVGRPLETGVSGSLWRSAKAASVVSLVLSLLPRKRTRRAAGIFGTLGGILLRFAVWQAGNASARDPQALFAQQKSDG